MISYQIYLRNKLQDSTVYVAYYSEKPVYTYVAYAIAGISLMSTLLSFKS